MARRRPSRPFTRALHAGAAAALAACLAVAGCARAPFEATAAPVTGDAAASARSRNLASWRDDVIYFVLTDRFHNGDRTNDVNVRPTDPNAYHGGDLKGVIQKLPYIKDLGATAIWITPINDNRDEALVDKYWGFHGYWTKDFDKVDEHLGDEATFKQLVKEAHAMGIKVLLDIVVNHAGYDAPMAKDPQFRDWFHHNGNITNWEDQGQLEYHDIHGLPDFNTEHPDVIKFMEDTWSGWIKRSAIDGFRIDTVKHVPMKFWSRFNQTIKDRAPSDFLLLGEVLHGDPGYVGSYTREGKFDTTFDFPMYFTLADVFARGQSMRKLGERLRQDGAYGDASLLSPFLDNHDVPRFMSTAGGDEKKLRLALAFLLTMRGVPMLYYGTENAMKGAGEPENREDMKFGQNPSLTNYVRQLNGLRRDLAPLRRGKMLEMWQDDDVYGFSRLGTGRAGSTDEVVVMLNNDGREQRRQVPLRAESALPDGTVLTDRLGGGSVTVKDHKLDVVLGPKQARVFVVAQQRSTKPKKD